MTKILLSFSIIIISLLYSCTSTFYEEWDILKRGNPDNIAFVPDVGTNNYQRSSKLYSLGNYRNVDVYADNAFTLKGSSSVAIALPESTQHLHDISLYFRTDAQLNIIKRADRVKLDGDEVRIELNSEGTKVYNGDRLVESNTDYKAMADKRIRVQLIEDGKYSIVIFDCDTIASVSSTTMGSENTIISNLQASDTVDVYGIGMLSLREWDRPEFVTRPTIRGPF